MSHLFHATITDKTNRQTQHNTLTCNKGCHLSQLPKANDQHIHICLSIWCLYSYVSVCVCVSVCVFVCVSTHSIDTVNNSCNCVQITELANAHLNAFALLFCFQLKLSLLTLPLSVSLSLSLSLSLSFSLIGIGYRTGEIKAANDNDVRQATL